MEAETKATPVVILGWGTAAVSAVMALRTQGYRGPIAVVTDDAAKPYSPVLTSYYASGRVTQEQCDPWADLAVQDLVDELHTHAHIEGLDVDAREIVYDGGKRLRYAKLLIATGAHPVAPGFPTSAPDADEPLMLRTMRDAERLARALQGGTPQRVLIAGTSMVALKALEACLERGANATILGRSDHILKNSAHPAIAAKFEQLLRERGVTLRLSQKAVHCEADEGRGGHLVTFDTGETVYYDKVICAQGVEPNLDFVPAGTLAIDRGIIVDVFMRASASDVFAAGDVAQALDLTTGEKRIVGLWQNAVQQGRVAAHTIAAEIAGRKPTTPCPGSIPANVIHMRDVLFASAGSVAEGANRRLEMREADGCTSVCVYDTCGQTERLVGFNLLTAGAPQTNHDALDDRIGRLRAEVRRSYLDIRGGTTL